MRNKTAWLVIKADLTMRVATRPRIGPNEVGVKLNLHYPDSWGRTVGEIDINLPDFTPEVKYEEVEP